LLIELDCSGSESAVPKTGRSSGGEKYSILFLLVPNWLNQERKWGRLVDKSMNYNKNIA
jgi:hypothetical protein